MMSRETVGAVLRFLGGTKIPTVDITGGAPELNPNFRNLVEGARRLGRLSIDRCNLTVFFERDMEWLPGFLTRQGVEVIASLPCYSAKNVDEQRGRGVFEKSIAALRWLNRLGYGRSDALKLNLVYNPLGASLPPPQAKLETDYKRQLYEPFGVRFDRLFTITNMPIKRFAEHLARRGQEAEYMSLLVNHFNPEAAQRVMCRSLVSVGWDGTLYDCDFNQMLELPIMEAGSHRALTVWDIDDLNVLEGRSIRTATHCFGCTAGAGSSCAGALHDEPKQTSR
jgi:radical SAM/Cys-rich protein